ncbi:4a-hydroxytetrahydrobiopterin dehydratase [Massilia horti]|uniref:4a-hydroxytetrahydrobiopterin dehydratase n=1 Tax=Massilia horti TaxID=2562153 RepID=A0A4Y9T8I2_9BURK|nr:4a-hydroxytetrahydrobiopterin dehydratase [Massilia horti]TFW34993.1 4a-hydroxytetrahydrobiopterin dehydratase [Massilia horti]
MNLIEKNCIHGAAAIAPDAIAALLPQVAGWAIEQNHLVRSFEFKDYHGTIEFVNALAWMIHAQNHHPELTVRYRHCIVSYTTHSAGNALSENDFICAAKANAIYDQRAGA